MSMIHIEVVYAEAASLWLRSLTLPTGSTMRDAIEASGFAASFPDHPIGQIKAGIYGQLCDMDRALANLDRIEIYRPLIFDPMESRRRRALHRKAFMTKPKNRPRRRKARIAAGLLATDPE